MLFDLRSRGRRRSVQIIYLALAVLIVVGLLGVGFGGSGLFSLASNGSGGSGSQSKAVDKQIKQAVAQTKAHPDSADAWAGLVQARFQAAGSTGFDSTTHSYTSTGQQQLSLLAEDYDRYLKLTSTPSPTTAQFAAEANVGLGRYPAALSAYQAYVGNNTSNVNGLQCVALSAVAAKNTRAASLAENAIYAKIPKADAAQVKAAIAQVKSQPSSLASFCGVQ